ncbi:MAG: YjfI family protein [Rhodothalassiaceae bacterium]
MSGDPTPAKARTQAWRTRLRQRGLVKLELWVKPEHRVPLRRLAQRLAQGAPLPSWTTTPAEEPAMPDQWTTQTLYEALADPGQSGLTPAEAAVSLVEGAQSAIRVTLQLYGDLDVYVSVEGDQILASVLLWPVAEQEDPDAFNRMILSLHKTLPLSTFGITSVQGEAYYELFGALSAGSVLASVVTEIRTLAANAIDVVEDLNPEAATEAA